LARPFSLAPPATVASEGVEVTSVSLKSGTISARTKLGWWDTVKNLVFIIKENVF
jgi:hypothetical protein